jgi:RsiW-degrading membrane proteinase PrsW (M82 family)
MTTILIAILVGVVSAFSKSLFDRIFREYNPDTKKLISKTMKFLLFILRYILPIVVLIYFFIEVDFNKLFVFVISIMLTILAVNLMIDQDRMLLNIVERMVEVSKKQSDGLSKIQDVILNDSKKLDSIDSNENKNNL